MLKLSAIIATIIVGAAGIWLLLRALGFDIHIHWPF